VSVQICDVQHWEKTIPLYSLLTMPEWSWPEFMSDRSMMSNQATKIKLHGTLLQICNTDTTTTALVNCYPLLIQSENPTRQHHSSCPFLFETCSFETNTTPCTSLLSIVVCSFENTTATACIVKTLSSLLSKSHWEGTALRKMFPPFVLQSMTEWSGPEFTYCGNTATNQPTKPK
jgi:hypothetical protein